MTKQNKIIYLFVTFVFFVIMDVFFTNLLLEYENTLPQNNIVDFVFVQNSGAAFSILEGSKWFLVSFAMLALLGIIVYIIKNIHKFSGIAVFFTSLLCAGIFTNMAERAVLGYVRDYIKLNFVDFPVFNISDIFINISVFFIVIIIIKNSYFKQ